MKFRLLILLTLFGLAVAPVSLFAQGAQAPQSSQGPCCPPTSSGTPTSGGGGFAADLNPYAGYVWAGNFTGIGNFKGNQVLGVRGGFFVTQGFEIGGNYYWNNHFLPRSANTGARLAGDLG